MLRVRSTVPGTLDRPGQGYEDEDLYRTQDQWRLSSTQMATQLDSTGPIPPNRQALSGGPQAPHLSQSLSRPKADSAARSGVPRRHAMPCHATADGRESTLARREQPVTGEDAQVIIISAVVVQDAKKNRRQG